MTQTARSSAARPAARTLALTTLLVLLAACADQLEKGPFCGDGIFEAPEECEDGNQKDGDGCTHDCKLSPCDGVATFAGSRVTLRLVASGLGRAVQVTAARADFESVFVVAQTGQVRIVRGGTVLDPPFLDIADRVGCCDEQGLLSIAFDPAFATNGRLFVSYTDPGGQSIVSSFTKLAGTADRADPASEKRLLTIPPRASRKDYGGHLAFGNDRLLYAGFGDGNPPGDAAGNAQSLAVLLGKILRLDVSAGNAYTVPPRNPFTGTAGARGEIWARGLRNPWRFSFDHQTGDLYIGDVGEDSWEEIDFEPAGSPGGRNYGWNLAEGDGHCFTTPTPTPTPTPRPTRTPMPSTTPSPTRTPTPTPVATPFCTGPELVRPIAEYSHASGCAVIGGHVYRGCALPDLRGTYFYGDSCSGRISSLHVSGGAATDKADRTGELGVHPQLTSFGEDARGEVYFVTIAGDLFEVVHP